ncbi:MAG: exonuclease domain-containing protein [Deltaproteobacteria bacterium]|nr:exonuclease domain-containing protein [Deltaproteobacteria bacterium]
MLREAHSYLVVDLEATCDDLGAVPRDEREIIEIGAVLVDGRSLRTVAELQMFVRPVLHPRLTPFCTELTTIAQADVDAAPHFPEAAARLAAFGRGALFCSWGNFDRNLFATEAERHRIAPPLGPAHENLKERFAEVQGRRRGLGAASALRTLGLAFAGTHHRGIDDARNIARTLPYLLGRVPRAAGPALHSRA